MPFVTLRENKRIPLLSLSNAIDILPQYGNSQFNGFEKSGRKPPLIVIR